MTFDPAAVASGLRPLAYLATVVARPAKARTALAWTAGRPLYRKDDKLSRIEYKYSFGKTTHVMTTI